MIIKGSARGATKADGAKLARHLLSGENETVSIIALDGVAATDLAGAIEEMRLLAMGTRARHGQYHASINLDRTEAPTMTTALWLECVDELARRLGMDGHARAIVKHVKRGRPHLHVVFSRVHPLTLRVARDSHNYRIHEQTSRALEERLQLRPVIGAHTRPKGTRRPVALATHDDWQAAERTGIPVQQVADKLRRAWHSTTTARAFQRAIEVEGWQLARGRRGLVLVDQAGTPHSIPRRLQLRAAEVHKRLATLNAARLPTVEDAKKGNRSMPKTTKFTASRGRRRNAVAELMPTNPAPSPDYWTALGYTVEQFPTHLTVTLSPNTKLHDYGDTLTLERAGEPTDEEIRVIVAAGKAKGWQEIRFFGGSEDFQRRARLEALRQGYRMDQISLECEDGKPKPLAALPMPEHIRRKLTPPPAETELMPTPPVPAPESPAPEFRP